jgi:solute carrier family 25, member 44
MAPTSTTTTTSQLVKWSEIDKFKFYSVGTVAYSALTLALHPMTVLKTRQQVLSSSTGPTRLHQSSLKSTYMSVMETSGVRGLFRGAGIVVALAVPARMVYITTLEASRHEVGVILETRLRYRCKSEADVSAKLPLVATIAGGLAGGLAAVSAQLLAVPMDVISQKQMVMVTDKYVSEGSSVSVIRAVIKSDGVSGLYRGFGLSMFTSLPTGSIWWATYGGCQHALDDVLPIPENGLTRLSQRGMIQVISGIAAAAVASGLTQPLDVIKTRLQVGSEVASTSATMSPRTIARDLMTSSGVSGFFRGLWPRIIYMSTWGTVLSSCYELLRHVSQKPQQEDHW